MRTHVEDQDLDHWAAPPLDPATVAALEAMGMRIATGAPDPDFVPVRKRPRWLAFLLRLIRYRE